MTSEKRSPGVIIKYTEGVEGGVEQASPVCKTIRELKDYFANVILPEYYNCQDVVCTDPNDVHSMLTVCNPDGSVKCAYYAMVLRNVLRETTTYYMPVDVYGINDFRINECYPIIQSSGHVTTDIKKALNIRLNYVLGMASHREYPHRYDGRTYYEDFYNDKVNPVPGVTSIVTISQRWPD